jgi:hypothetical protein
MSRISLVSFALLLVISCVARAWADPLADEMTTMNARWMPPLTTRTSMPYYQCIPLMPD